MFSVNKFKKNVIDDKETYHSLGRAKIIHQLSSNENWTRDNQQKSTKTNITQIMLQAYDLVIGKILKKLPKKNNNKTYLSDKDSILLKACTRCLEIEGDHDTQTR